MQAEARRIETGLAFGRLSPWPRHLLLLAIMAGFLLALGREDMAAIVGIWERTGDFHHCFLIPPIIVWLVWQRRDVLALLTPEYALRGALVAGLGAMLWLVGAAGYIALLRQAGLVISAIGLVIALLGVSVARALRFPLGFALFLIPAGSEFEPMLQIATARIAVALLQLTGTPAMIEGVFIETPAGLFRVAESCSGTAFLLAMATYAVLVAAMCFESARRRLLFMGAAMLVALLTNGLRAFGIMKLANLTSIHNPAVRDHLLFGWLLFAIVVALLMWTASHWFDRDMDAPIGDARNLQGVTRSRTRGRLVLPVIFAVLLLPRFWLFATTPAVAALPAPVAPNISGWKRILTGQPDWRPHFIDATWIGQWRYVRDTDGRVVDFAIILFDRQEEGREIVAFGQGAAAPEGDWANVTATSAPDEGRGEWLRGPAGLLRYAATWYLVGGDVTGSPIMAKAAAIHARLTGGEAAAAAILLSTPDRKGTDAPTIVADFIHAGGSVQEMADRARAMR